MIQYLICNITVNGYFLTPKKGPTANMSFLLHPFFIIKCYIMYTVEPVLKDHSIGHKNVVCQDRWSLMTGSIILKCRSFCQKSVVC